MIEETQEGWVGEKFKLTVGKYPKVKTLNKEVFPQAPSPIMTSFLAIGLAMRAAYRLPVKA